MMKIFIEGMLLSVALFLFCYIKKKKSPVNLVYFYEKDVRERAVTMGLTTHEKIGMGLKTFKLCASAVFVIYLPVCVCAINGTREFIDIFLQMLAILAIEGLFDRLVIDGWWVGCTSAWIIPGTEDLMPYIPAKVHVRKWIGMLVLYPVVAAILAGIFSLIFLGR